MIRRGRSRPGWPGITRACAAAAVLGAASLLGCPVPPVPPPEPCDKQVVTLNLYAADNINPNEEERPRPVVVRLYQLANDLRMASSKYDDILLRDKETLKEDVLKVDEVEVFPNDLVEIKFERIPEATFLVGAAMFRTPKGHSWKTYYIFPPMPNAPAGCAALAPDVDAGAADPAPKTAFFVEGSQIDNGSQFDESMFTQSTPLRRISLPKHSATSDSYATPPAGPAGR
ncbi:MAG: type VI secretion system lipoprotein TssJ [Deltaproteobacteria bacterium]|nr:type VI secretion system lipoprotein TssJ [Deltaproteobacteria bacterium]